MNRIQNICRYCPKRGQVSRWCNLLYMPLSMASISANCPFEDLDENDDINIIRNKIKDFQMMEELNAFLRNKE